MEPTKGMSLTVEGIPGDFIRNKNIAGDPDKNNFGGTTRSFTIRLTPEYAKMFEDAGFPIRFPKDIPPGREPEPYVAVVLFPEAKFNYAPSIVVSDDGTTRRMLAPNNWKEFDWSPIEYIDADLRTYKTKTGNIAITADILYFHTKNSALRNKLADVFAQDDMDPAPF